MEEEQILITGGGIGVWWFFGGGIESWREVNLNKLLFASGGVNLTETMNVESFISYSNAFKMCYSVLLFCALFVFLYIHYRGVCCKCQI